MNLYNPKNEIYSELVNLPDTKQARLAVKFDLNGFMESFGKDQTVQLNSYSPVVQKRIGVNNQKNISITGKFRTNYVYSDASYWGGYSFIQVRKNSSGKASAYSGYGIAWRPSAPDLEVLIPITNAAASDMGSGYWDITYSGTIDTDSNLMYVTYYDSNKLVSVPFHYSESDGGVLRGCYIPTVGIGILQNPNTKLAFTTPNLYIVDNDPVHGDHYSSRNVIDPLTGLSFIQSATVQINTDTSYYFRMDITDQNAISLYLSEDEDTLGDAETLMIFCGATTPVSEYLGGSNMDSFGLSVFDTGGFQWWYDNVKIAKLSGEYSVAYFRFDVTNMSDDLQLEISAFGESSAPDATPTNGIIANAWNPVSASWDNILTASLDASYAVMVSNIISRSLYSKDGKITIMVTTRNPSIPESPSVIHIDYIKMVRASVLGVHAGGCVDLYIDDPSAIYTSKTVTVNEDSCYIDISDYLSLSSIWIGETELMYSRDYIIVEGDPGTFNTTRSNAKARFAPSFAGSDVTVYYWESSNMTELQTLLEGDTHRPITTDVLVRHKRIHEIKISEGGAPYRESTQRYIDGLEYINGIKTLSYSDLSRHMYNENGVYPILRLSISTYDSKKRRLSTLDKMGNEYPIAETDTFRIIA